MMNSIRNITLGLLLAVTAFAQTSPSTGQLKSPVPGVTAGTLLIVLPTGKVAVVNLGPCFSITTATPPLLQFNPAVSGCVPAATTTTAGPNFSDAEVPAGVPAGPPNGVLNTFTLAHANGNTGSSLILSRNGIVQQATVDYTLLGNVITFQAASIPQTGDLLQAWYRY